MNARMIVLAMVLLSMGTPAWAGDNAVSGLLIGAGSGALIGQAIGRDTSATLIGTAVGSFLGYAAGNEMDKSGRLQPVVARRVAPWRGRAMTARLPVWVEEEQEPICRETVMLAEVDGRPERVHGVACIEDGEWVLTSVAARDDHEDDCRRTRHHRRHHDRRRLYRRARWW